MQCMQCGCHISDERHVCPVCDAALRVVTGGDDSTARHTVGRIRAPTIEESGRPESFFRADAVLALTVGEPTGLRPGEAGVARLIDGFRPLARVRRKSGAASVDFRNAVRGLHERGLLRLVGMVEAAGLASTAEHGDLDATRRVMEAEMMVSPRVMAEIEAMTDEENSMLDGDDTEVDIGTAPKAERFPNDG